MRGPSSPSLVIAFVGGVPNAASPRRTWRKPQDYIALTSGRLSAVSATSPCSTSFGWPQLSK